MLDWCSASSGWLPFRPERSRYWKVLALTFRVCRRESPSESHQPTTWGHMAWDSDQEPPSLTQKYRLLSQLPLKPLLIGPGTPSLLLCTDLLQGSFLRTFALQMHPAHPAFGEGAALALPCESERLLSPCVTSYACPCVGSDLVSLPGVNVCHFFL